VTATVPGEHPRLGLWQTALALGLACFALHLAGTWALPLLDRDEPRFAEASREMLQRGDWVVPWFNNSPRYDKPPLVYWLQMAGYRWLGESELTARLPSVLAAALTAVAILGFGSRMGNRSVGLWSALMFSTCLQTLVHAKLAVADMLMICCFTMAAWCGWELGRAEDASSCPGAPRHGWRLGFVISLALAFLAKGPVGWLPLLLPLLAPVWHRRPIAWSRLRLGYTVPLVLGLVALWGVPALLRTEGEFWDVGMGRHVFQRSIGVLEGHGARGLFSYLATTPLYFVTVFASFFPWSLWLVWLGRQLRHRRQALTFDEKYLLAGVGLIFGVFSLVRTKLPHYTLPAFPLLALLLVGAWERTGGAPMPGARRWVVGMGGFGLAVSLLVFPLVAPLFPSPGLARECAPWLRPHLKYASAGFEEPSLCWYFRSRVRGFLQPLPFADLPVFMAKPGLRLCILPTEQVASVFPRLPDEWKRVQICGFSPAHGRIEALTALVKAGDALSEVPQTAPP